MNISELITELAQKGIRLQANQNRISIRSSKGILTPELKAKLTEYKPEILAFLQQTKYGDETLSEDAGLCGQTGLSLNTLGRLIGGFTNPYSTEYRPPVIDQTRMAEKLTVTFRPLPKGYNEPEVLKFREELQIKLANSGVTVKPWEQATVEYPYQFKLPFLRWKKSISVTLVKAGVSAVIDVERNPSWLRKLGMRLAELNYTLYRFFSKNQTLSIFKIAEIAGWAEDNTRVEDPSNTQVIILTALNPQMANPLVPYRSKIKIGLNTLVRTFSEMVVGVSEDTLSILNMNLSDSTFPRQEVDQFVLNSLVPKIFVPILPLPLSRFTIEGFDPRQSIYAQKLVALGKALAPTGLFPAGAKLSKVIRRRSHRDMVNIIMNGRTGVSYGFVAYAEPPRYQGALEITAGEWEELAPVPGFSPSELRQTESERWYLKQRMGDRYSFRQIPDIWLVCSRSGSNKTNLNLETDVTRIGLCKTLMLQLPYQAGVAVDIKPSYDLYVMLAIALGAALYAPDLIEHGAPIIHFHGYPSANWFQANEYWAGVTNPSVPCGTYESGVFNFLGIHSLIAQAQDGIALASLIEPDHGTNIIARDMNYLLDRLKAGCESREIELGGRYFASLKRQKAKQGSAKQF